MMPAHAENKSLAKMRYFVESCVTCKDVGVPETEGHVVQLVEERGGEKIKRMYYSLERYEKYTSFEEPPETMNPIPLIHCNKDYKTIRNFLLERKAAKGAEGRTE
ncbi:MAG: hypothetical protein WCX64_00860 [Candidatus Micrarchaeia archaeon]|jgi:hypothetical protein